MVKFISYNKDISDHWKHLFLKDFYFDDFELLKDKKILLFNDLFDEKLYNRHLEQIKSYNLTNEWLIIIDSKYESLTWKIIDSIDNFFKNEKLNYFLIHSGLDKNEKYKDLIFSPYFFQFDCPAEQNDIFQRSKKYLALDRIMLKDFRVIVIQELFKRDLLKYGLVSCGSGLEDHSIESLLRYKDYSEDFKKILPLRIEDHFIKNELKLTFTYPPIMSAQFNVILESSFEHFDGSNGNIGYQWGWNRPFFTEKTAKCFNCFLIPIFVAPMGYVQRMRNFGFDVFDDIVNHEYDLETNPETRLFKVVDEIERLCQIDLIDNNINERLYNNSMNMKKLSIELKNEFKNSFKNKLLTKLNINH